MSLHQTNNNCVKCIDCMKQLLNTEKSCNEQFYDHRYMESDKCCNNCKVSYEDYILKNTKCHDNKEHDYQNIPSCSFNCGISYKDHLLNKNVKCVSHNNHIWSIYLGEKYGKTYKCKICDMKIFLACDC